jgi:hypothetical protein
MAPILNSDAVRPNIRQLEEIVVTDTQRPVAWRAVVYGTPVVSADGQRVGEVHEMLGSDADDIFHGIRLARGGGHPDALVESDDVASLTATEIRLGLSRLEVEALPAYAEAATYHLASVGWLRKHLGWKKDSESDDEPG